MDKQLVIKLKNNFEKHANKKENIEFWFARDLQKLLGYTEWRKFLGVVKKAMLACENSDFLSTDHFVETAKKVKLGSDAIREIHDIMLTRYACYLIAQNGDSRKTEIAFAQSYFAIQTRKQELIEERIALKERFEARDKLVKSETELSKLIFEKGVDNIGFARIRSKGDWALFGGNDTNTMKMRLGIPKKRPLADFLPTVTIAAKNFATEITNFNVKNNNLFGENKISSEHIKNNKKVRKVMLDDNIVPENLPAEEDIKKQIRRIKTNEKRLGKHNKLLKENQ